MNINFKKGNGLVPAIIQDSQTGVVLMLGYMNRESLQKTRDSGKVTFYSRSRDTLWTKGETSGNVLLLDEIRSDCDGDTLLITARPTGPVCHTGADTCFSTMNRSDSDFFKELETIIAERRKNPDAKSYTNSLFQAGVARIAQKVGEEATETIIEAMRGDRDRLKEETADLIYHLLVLLRSQEISLADISTVLEERHRPRE